MIVTETIFRMVWFVPLFFMWVSQLFTVFHVFFTVRSVSL